MQDEESNIARAIRRCLASDTIKPFRGPREVEKETRASEREKKFKRNHNEDRIQKGERVCNS